MVASHPKTGERAYVEVQMPPGAPRVTYRYDFIEYDFGHKAIIVRYGHHGKASVTFREGRTVAERVREARDEARENRRDAIAGSGVADGRRKLHEVARNVAANTGSGVKKLGKAALSPVTRLVNATPLANLGRPPQNRAQAGVEPFEDRAASEEAGRGGTVSTNR